MIPTPQQAPPQQVIAASMLDPKLLHSAWHDGSVMKVQQHPRRWMPLAFLAGLYIAIGTLTYTVMMSDPTQRTPLARAAAGLGFSVGLIMIMMTGAELYTGSCMELMAVLNGTVTPVEMAIDLTRKWSANFVGCIFFAAIVVGMGYLGYPSTSLTPVGNYLCDVAIAKANLNWWEIFFRGILAALLICLAVLMCVGSKSPTGKVISVAYPVTVGGVLGFEHCIANMFTFSAATMIGCDVSNHGYYWLNLLLSTLGNLVGGWLIAFLYFHGFIASVLGPPPPAAGAPSSSSEPVSDSGRNTNRQDTANDVDDAEDYTKSAGQIAVEMVAKATTPRD